MHEIKCKDCGKHLGWVDVMDEALIFHNVGDYHYCDGCAAICGNSEARKFVPTIEIDETTNVDSHDHPAHNKSRVN